MKTTLLILAAMTAANSGLMAQGSGAGYTNYIFEIALPAGNVRQVSGNLPPSGEMVSTLPMGAGGIRYELWTLNSTPLTETLLVSTFVSDYAPKAKLTITSEDPYATIPRTRVDRPFTVSYAMKELQSAADAPLATKSVNLLQHVQSYGPGGTGIGINRDNATLVGTPTQIAQNTPPAIPPLPGEFVAFSTFLPSPLLGTPFSKARGEQRFSIYTLPDYQAPPSLLASQYVQIWPIATGSISGITEGQLVRFAAPSVSFSLTDLYPSSNVYAQVYKGGKKLGQAGVIVPGSSLVLNETLPQNRVLTISNWDRAMDEDGEWTLELVSETVFDTMVLHAVTFKIDRTIQVNGNLSTMD